MCSVSIEGFCSIISEEGYFKNLRDHSGKNGIHYVVLFSEGSDLYDDFIILYIFVVAVTGIIVQVQNASTQYKSKFVFAFLRLLVNRQILSPPKFKSESTISLQHCL